MITNRRRMKNCWLVYTTEPLTNIHIHTSLVYTYAYCAVSYKHVAKNQQSPLPQVLLQVSILYIETTIFYSKYKQDFEQYIIGVVLDSSSVELSTTSHIVCCICEYHAALILFKVTN